MSENNLNLLPAQENKNESSHFSTPKTKRPWKKIILLIITIALIGSFFSFLSSLFSDNGLIRSLAKLNLFSQFTQLITNKNLPLMGAENDRINILVMGIGGKNHDGGTLADTMFLGSYKPSTKQAALMSIPRDLWVKTDRFGYSKINAINAYAEAKNPGSGGQATLDVVNKLLDTKIPYFITIDFDGFERVIDEFGGVDIYVDRDLIDYQYPIRGKEMIFPIENRFETLNIKKGQHHFDGAMALKYARSRHALGAEGSDFARSKRQQKIITAMKEKIVSLDTLFNPSKLNSLLTAYNEHIVTNLQLSDLLQLAQWGKDIDQTQITSVALSDAPNGFLYADNLNGAYVLLPNVSDFSEIKNVWNYIFYKNQETKISTREPQLVSTEAKISDTNTTKTTTTKIITTTSTNSKISSSTITSPITVTTIPLYQQEKATIEIQNGTWTEGYASKEKTRLIQLGFNVTTTGNAVNHDFQETQLFDLSKGKYPATTSGLEGLYNAKVSKKIPLEINSTADFVIILGKQ